MSVPQIPTRWTRTSASPGPGPAGASVSMLLKLLGASRSRAFIGVLSAGSDPGLRGRVVVLGPPLGVMPVVDRLEDLEDLGQQRPVDRPVGPIGPFPDVLGVGRADDAGRHVLVG